MFFEKSPRRRRRRPLPAIVLPVLLLLTLLGAVEAYRAYGAYSDLRAAQAGLLSIRDELDISQLRGDDGLIRDKQVVLIDAGERLESARGFVEGDPVLGVMSRIPLLGEQMRGLRGLVVAADEAAETGLQATEVALAFARYERDPQRTSIEEALGFLDAQQPRMVRVSEGLARLQVTRRELPQGLAGPLASAEGDLDRALLRLEALVQGYDRAQALLPELLGVHGARRYLVLPQNDTELFPSGGLISSYGIVTFEGGRLAGMEMEYFGTLFDRWQAETGEYVEPPAPLKAYLKQGYSWGLGEAGWYPDFPTTATLAASFVAKGGAPATEGTIAIDLKFIRELLALLGPVEVADYNVTVDAANVEELTLEMTRDEEYTPGEHRKAFLSHLAQSLLGRVFSAPKEQWLELLGLLERMGQERHLQLHFESAELQSLNSEYGLDGAVEEHTGDYLLIADTSVNSTKLNLILEPRAKLELQLTPEGSARSLLSYRIDNPFPDWQEGRDSGMVRALMLDGVYGCYLRVYAPEQARLLTVRLDGALAGVEQSDMEVGRRVFGRFLPVQPGGSSSAQLLYETPRVVQRDAYGLHRYSLYVQKQAGTEALPLDVQVTLPPGARLESVLVDGERAESTRIRTDLRTDRLIEVLYRLS